MVVPPIYAKDSDGRAREMVKANKPPSCAAADLSSLHCMWGGVVCFRIMPPDVVGIKTNACARFCESRRLRSRRRTYPFKKIARQYGTYCSLDESPSPKQDKSEAKAKKATKQGVILDLTHKSTMDSSAERRGNRITESVQGHRFPVEYRRPPAAVPRDPQIYAPELLEANASLRLVDR